MKKFVNAIAFYVLSAILLVSYSAGMAQSATVTGVVYENDQSKISFETPKGKIKIYLPDDMAAGDVITGRVVDEPSGSNEKQKMKNLQELQNYKIMLPDGKQLTLASTGNPSLNNGQAINSIKPFTLSTSIYGNSFSITLNSPDNKPVSTANIPTLPVTSPITAGNTAYALDKKIVENTEPLVLLQSSAGSGAVPQLVLHPYYNSPSPGVPSASYTLEVLAASPRKIIYALPQGISGMFSVCVQLSNGKPKTIDLVNVVGINASIGKASLLKGEQTPLNVQVTGLEGCLYRPVQLEISNKTTSIIHLQNGDQQLFPVDQSNSPIALATHQPFNLVQNITGQTTGNFVINTALHIPVSAYANPVQPYLSDINTPQQFNSSMKAMKMDIDNFIKTNKMPYLQQVKDQLPTVSGMNDLGKAKSMVGNMLNPLSATKDGQTFFKQMKELNKLHPSLASQAMVPQLVHPLHDLAGEFDVTARTLKVQDAYKESLLQYLGAKKAIDGNYSFMLSDGNKMVTYNNISVKSDPNEPGALCDLTGYGKNSVHDPPPTAPVPPSPVSNNTNFSATPKDSAKSDMPKPTSTFTDSTGRKYWFYKDAECQELLPATKSECQPQIDRIWNPEKKGYDDKATGNYERWDIMAYRICVQGTGFCTRMQGISSVQMIFEDKECKRMIKVNTYENYNCP